jgi:hypothetical protein
MEHRWGTRIRMELPVRISSPGGACVDGQLVDISLSGAFLRLPVRPPDLSLVHVEFVDLPVMGVPLLRAQVVRYNEAGIGLEWDTQGSAEVRRLLLLLAGRGALGNRYQSTEYALADTV